MFHTLKNWLSRSKVTTRSRRGHPCRSVRPALEALEDRQLLSAYPVVNSMVNEDFVLYQNGSLRKIDHNFYDNKTAIDGAVRANSLSMGTDASGRGMAAFIDNRDGQAYEWDDTTHQMLSLSNSALGVTNNVKSVAAGQGGIVFVLTTDNRLTKFDTAHQNWTAVGDNVASVRASASYVEQSTNYLGAFRIDTVKSTMADVLKTDGTAWEWTETTTNTYLLALVYIHVGTSQSNSLTPLANSSLGITNNVKSVSRAATGVSFVLLTSGELFEFDASSHTWTDLGGNIASVSAGTDSAGHAMASVIDLNGRIWDWSTTHPWDGVHGFYQELFCPGITISPLQPSNPFGSPSGFGNHSGPLPAPKFVVSFNAGANGVADVVLSDGSLYQYSDVTHRWNLLDTGVA
jgi:hypothetical protein